MPFSLHPHCYCPTEVLIHSPMNGIYCMPTLGQPFCFVLGYKDEQDMVPVHVLSVYGGGKGDKDKECL